MTKTLSAEALHDMTESEINAVIFKGARVDEPRGLREMLGDELVLALFDHPCFGEFSEGFKSWAFSAFDAMDREIESESI